MSRLSNTGASDFRLDNTPDDNVIRQLKSAPRLIKPSELKSLKGAYFCPYCRAIFHTKSWHNDLRQYEKIKDCLELARMCPACYKTEMDLPEGIITFTGLDNFPLKRKKELINLVRNIWKRAEKRDPMDRVFKILDKGNEIQVYTTENQLALAIGNEVKRALGGDLNIGFGQRENKIARIVWVAKS